MKRYIVTKDVKALDGSEVLKKGDTLRSMKIGTFSLYGKDKNNRFWTDEFLDKNPELFEKKY